MQLSIDDKHLLNLLSTSFAADGRDPVGVAVSGGGDSMALLHLMSLWAAGAGVTLKAVTVDHALRAEAADEAVSVGEYCKTLGVAHSTLRWEGWDRSGNLQDAARRARYAMMADWARSRGVKTIVLGHTADDQAETFLMRLAREAGVDGLAGMAASRQAYGIEWQRPLLRVGRQALRDYLRRNGIVWFDDPSNEDEKYDRIKARKIMRVLAPLGIDVGVLAGVTGQLASARQALEIQTEQAARAVVRIEAGDVCFERGGFLAQPPEITRRLLIHALKWVSSAEYAPRGRAIADLRFAIVAKEDATLCGCRILSGSDGIRVVRELQAVKDLRCGVDDLWDRRWRISGTGTEGYEIAALGENGLKECGEWRETGLSRAGLLASPAVWQEGALIAAPLAGFSNGWGAELEKGENHFYEAVLSH
ncbi:MAG: tRNA lysidine(34) synthetase TilS [Paracoccaceae bacterium]